MDRRRRLAALGGAFAALCGSVAAAGAASRTSTGSETVLGLPMDFWRGVPIGLGLTLAVAATVWAVRQALARKP